MITMIGCDWECCDCSDMLLSMLLPSCCDVHPAAAVQNDPVPTNNSPNIDICVQRMNGLVGSHRIGPKVWRGYCFGSLSLDMCLGTVCVSTECTVYIRCLPHSIYTTRKIRITVFNIIKET